MKAGRKLLLGAGGACALLLLVLFCASRGGRVAVQVARPPRSLDPARPGGFEERLVCGALYEPLVSYDPSTGRAAVVLAARWEVGGGGRIYTFYLREDARVHSGKRVTAADVKYSWERVLRGDCSYLLQGVCGAGEARRGGGARGITALDSRTLRVCLERPDWTFLARASSPVLAVVSREAVERAGRKYGAPGTRVVGTGPFLLARWEGKVLHLRRFHRWHGTKPILSRLDFYCESDQQKVRALFAAGRLHVLAGVAHPAAYRKKKGVSVVRQPVPAVYFLCWNLEHPGARASSLRAAVAAAVDREEITEKLLGEAGEPQEQLIPPELLPPAQASAPGGSAIALLAAAGHPYGAGLPPLELASNAGRGHEALGRFLQEQLGRVGLDMRLRFSPWEASLAGHRKSAYGFFRLGWEADYPEPGSFLLPLFSASAPHNYTGYQDPGFEACLTRAREERDFARRAEVYREAERFLLRTHAVIPLFRRVVFFVLCPGVRGFQVDALGMVDFARLSRGKP